MLAPLLIATCCAVQDPAPAPRPALQIVGRLVDPLGAPQAEIAVQAGMPGPRGGSVLSTPSKTDGDGRFMLDLEGSASEVSLWLSSPTPGRATTRWTVDHVTLGAPFDVGTLVARPEVIVTGHIVDLSGTLLTEGWIVQGHATPTSDGRALANHSARATIDPLSGLFTLRGLPQGAVSVLAKGPLGAQTERIALESVAGCETEVQLVHAGPLVGQISLVLTEGPAPLSFGTLSARAEDGEVVRFRQITDPAAPGRKWAGGLDPLRRWSLQHEDARYLPFASIAVRPGGQTTVALVPRGAFELEVMDASTGVPLDAYSAEVVESIGLRRRHVVVGLDSTRPTRVEEVLPTVVFVSVSAAGYPIHETTLAVPVGSVPRLRVKLAKAEPLKGRVVTRAGVPVSGATVEATPGHGPGSDPKSAPAGSRVHSVSGSGVSLRFELSYVARTTTDAAGHFVLTDLAPGPVMLVVRRDNAVPAEVAIEHRAETRGSAAPAAVHRVEVDPLPTIVRDS